MYPACRPRADHAALSVHHWFVSQKKTRAPEEIECSKQRVSKAKLPIVAELGNSHISIQEFLELAVGDVISLNKSIDEGWTSKSGTS